MRYRRIYAKVNDDHSVSVVSVGPVGSAWIGLWGSVFGTFILTVIAFCFINPFPRATTAFVWWAVSWGVVFAAADLFGNQISRRRRAKREMGESRPPPPRPGGLRA